MLYDAPRSKGWRVLMNQALFQELRKLQNEIADGPVRPDALYLAKRLQELKISIPTFDLPWGVAVLLHGFNWLGEYIVPPLLPDIFRCLLEGRSANLACDPWAGIGVLAAVVHEAVHAHKTFACTRHQHSAALGQVLAPQLDWRVEDPLAFLETLTDPLDVITSVLPFGVQANQAVELRNASGETVRCAGELGPILLAAACMRLSPEGLGLFVVTPSFFLSQRSILRDLPRLGLGVEAALALPAGSFAPFTNIATYLIVVRRRASARMFVAQLSTDVPTNRQIMTNLRGHLDTSEQSLAADVTVVRETELLYGTGGAVELGRFVAPASFRGLEHLRLAEELRKAEHRLQRPAVGLGELAQAIHLGRPGDEFAFPKTDNALYVPLIGISDVVNSTEEMTLKHQNYAQVVIGLNRSDARFVARFLNSELGRSIREANKSGTTIPKLNTTGLKELLVFVPNLETQKKILETTAKLTAEQNMLLGLQNDLAALYRQLWNTPGQLEDVDSQLRAFSSRLTSGATLHGAATLDQWFETLPFPLASILRAWQATPTQDYKTKHEHLLHFFEAAAEFLSIIYLSAFSSQTALFVDHKEKLAAAWKKQNLSLQRATFGTWKVVVEYFSKQTRELLSGDTEKGALCAELFGDPTRALPEMLARKEMAAVLSAANKMRNDWTGHGGVVSQPEARLRNEQLLTELQKLRETMADGWHRVQLIRCLQCQPRRGVFDNEVAVLVGSNSEFLKESRPMSSWLDVERLYLASRDSGRALLLLPLIQVGPSPASAKNACYFFNRVEKDGARFISYHFVDQPEIKDQSVDTSAAILLLSEVSAGNDH